MSAMRTTGNPELVSVVVAVRDSERFLGEAIESILAQDYEPLELIVVDDGSTDGTAEVARSYLPAVRVVSQAPLGVGAALNTGIGRAQGPLLAFLDADDVWLPGKLAVQTAALRERPDVDVVFAHVEQFFDADPGAAAIAAQPGWAKQTMLIRRAAFDRVGPFSTELRLGDFIDWWARATELGLTSLMLPDLCARRRLHDDNSGIRFHAERDDYLRVLKAALDRRRAAS
jgi:glycosyltransferase involved in cell wall biosynthesis